MQLEQITSGSSRLSESDAPRNYFVIGDLESLSAGALYGSGPIGHCFGPIGGGSSRSIGGSGPLGRNLSSAPLRNSSGPLSPRFSKNTGYFPLIPSKSIGITHHNTGLGKLKVVDNDIEYGVPLIDILNKAMKNWRIEKK